MPSKHGLVKDNHMNLRERAGLLARSTFDSFETPGIVSVAIDRSMPKRVTTFERGIKPIVRPAYVAQPSPAYVVPDWDVPCQLYREPLRRTEHDAMRTRWESGHAVLTDAQVTSLKIRNRKRK